MTNQPDYCQTCGAPQVDDAHLNLLRKLRARINDAIFSEENPCPPRDLASLTRRLQDVSREIEAIEERVKRERQTSGSANGSKADDGSWDPSKV